MIRAKWYMNYYSYVALWLPRTLFHLPLAMEGLISALTCHDFANAIPVLTRWKGDRVHQQGSGQFGF
jgi:hypothetical protein